MQMLYVPRGACHSLPRGRVGAPRPEVHAVDWPPRARPRLAIAAVAGLPTPSSLRYCSTGKPGPSATSQKST